MLVALLLKTTFLYSAIWSVRNSPKVKTHLEVTMAKKGKNGLEKAG
jgi:hypothetical protein